MIEIVQKNGPGKAIGDPHPKEMFSIAAGWRYSWALLVYRHLLGAASSGGLAKAGEGAAGIVSCNGCFHLEGIFFDTEPSGLIIKS